MINVKGIRHTGLYVNDMDKMKDFYVNLLGMKIKIDQIEKGDYIRDLIGKEEKTNVETCKMYFADGSMIELCKVQGAADVSDDKNLYDAGTLHIALTVYDADEAYRKLNDAGMGHVSKPLVSPDGGAKVFFARDPEGNYLEIVEELKSRVSARKQYAPFNMGGDEAMKYGIMQGRLTPSNGRGIQFFPFENWENEFRIAQEIGIDEIEFIFDYDRHEENPLWTDAGTKRIANLIQETGVQVRSICFDYFMRRPFFKAADDDVRESMREENITMIERVASAAEKIGASLIEVPLVDDSSVYTTGEWIAMQKFIHEVADTAQAHHVTIGVETDFDPPHFNEFLRQAEDAGVMANYDTGNSSGIGYDHYEEITTLDKRIANVHIKDRKLHGMTMKLGTGSANFDDVFRALKEVGYCGSIIMQAARGEDGKEAESIRSQIEFVKGYVKKYGLEDARNNE